MTILTTEPDVAAEAQTAAPADDITQQAQAPATDEGENKSSVEQSAVENTGDDQKPAEDYEITAPEGVVIDGETSAAFNALSKELALSQEQSQKIVDRIAPMIAAQQTKARDTAMSGWESAAKSDAEFGGEKITESLSVAKRALSQFGSAGLRELLNSTGLGSHPEIIRLLYRAGKSISEDTIAPQSTSAPTQTDPARVMFPNQK